MPYICNMLSKNRIKYIHSLEQKKVRKAEKVFLAEGPKLVGELLGQFNCQLLLATPEWLNSNILPQNIREVTEVSDRELAQASLLKTPQQVLGVFEQAISSCVPTFDNKSLWLCLDDVQDPGNLGTIIRLADWFGIEHIFCSPGCADIYNPKTVQATMGALARVTIHYQPLVEVFSQLKDVPIYGTFLEGENIYQQSLSGCGVIVMGNEGNGISREVEQWVNHRLYIPNYPPQRSTSESLNVAIATSIVCAEFRRQLAWQ